MTDVLDILYLLGRPLSPLYSAIMRARSTCSYHGLLKSKKMDVPVLSVGNLTMGGTGKTPVVHYIAGLLRNNGYNPSIVSRGYGGKCKDKINVVSNGKELLMSAEEAGDEPRFLAESLPGTPVITGRKRIHPCNFAFHNLGADILILDDGFQHLAVKRDLDLVLFNAATLTRNMRVFPGGVLREPFSALSRASCLVITGVNGDYEADIHHFINRFQKDFPATPVFSTSYLPQYAKEKNSEGKIPFENLPLPLFGFCGIASPQRFQKSLASCGIHLKGFKALRDHQPYTPEFLKKIEKEARLKNCKALITTEKDMVKLSSLTLSMPLYTIVMKVCVDVSFDAYILQNLNSLSG